MARGREDAVLRQQAGGGRDAYVAGRDIYIGHMSGTAASAGRVDPDGDAWVASVHASEDTQDSLGCGVVIDERRVLTCAHVVGAGGRAAWVSFPKAEDGDSDRRARVERTVLPAGDPQVRDLAILYLAEPVPAGVMVAPLRCPRPRDLVEKRWWAFGFPDGDPVGDSADGKVGAALAHGWIRLEKGSRHAVQRGFSGGGLWSPDYKAVVAVVCQAGGELGDGRAITLYQADGWFPSEKIRILTEQWSASAAGEVALSAWGMSLDDGQERAHADALPGSAPGWPPHDVAPGWGWSLEGDKEAARHWRPRGRGVSVDSERGYRFRGRVAALEAIRDWLDVERLSRRVLVVTGAPGVGKSAVLGRIVTTADPDAARQLPSDDRGGRATVGSVGCAVHAKGKTALEVATEIARAASAALPEYVEDFAPALRAGLLPDEDAAPGPAELGGRPRRRFNVIIDALDEAASPAEARAVIKHIILPISETCSDIGAQVVVGSRRTDGDGDLLATFGGAARLVDLDAAAFFEEEDLTAYALATLQLTGDERAGNPYADEAVAVPVAKRIARLSKQNFLVAGLTARTYGLYDEQAADPTALTFSPRVEDAMREYLRRIPPVAGRPPAEPLLTALAFAEAPGLSAPLWRTALRALGVGDVPEQALTEFARSSAASFLVESSGDDTQGATFRLFHQALNEALLHARTHVASQVQDERVLTQAFLEFGRNGGWDNAPGYLLRSLPAHAIRGQLTDDLLAEDAYLLHADLRRVMQVTGHATSPAGRTRTRLLGLSLQASTAGPGERVALFSVTETLDGLGTTYREGHWAAAYRAEWATTEPRSEHAILRGHSGAVSAVCVIPVADGNTLLASGSLDSTVRLWDPHSGDLVRVLRGHEGGVLAVCAVPLPDGRSLLASGSLDSTVRLWDPHTGELVGMLRGHEGGVNAVCAVRLPDGCSLLASGSDDRTVRLWDPRGGELVRVLHGHDGGVNAVCAVPPAGRRSLLASGGDTTLRFWDLESGQEIRVVEPRGGWIYAACAIPLAGGRSLLATGSGGASLRLWDAESGEHARALRGYGQQDDVFSVCAIPLDGGNALLASSSSSKDGAVRLWDPQAGKELRILLGHEGGVFSMCAVPLDGGSVLLATGGEDRTVRLWDPQIGKGVTAVYGHRRDEASSICSVTSSEGRALLATGGQGFSVQLLDLRTGVIAGSLHTAYGSHAVCAIPQEGKPALLATGSKGGMVRLWDPQTGEESGTLCGPDGELISTGHADEILSLCAVPWPGRQPMLATGGKETVQLWDLERGRQAAVLSGHRGSIYSLCVIPLLGKTLLLASSAEDRTIRLWDPQDHKQVRVLRNDAAQVHAICAVIVPAGSALLAGGDDDGVVRLWDPRTGGQVRLLQGHEAEVTAVCMITASGDVTLLASGSRDRTVRLWNPATGECILVVPVHYPVQAIAWADDSLCVGLDAGVLTIRLGDLGLAAR